MAYRPPTVTWHGPMGPMQVVATGDIGVSVYDNGSVKLTDWKMRNQMKKPKKTKKPKKY